MSSYWIVFERLTSWRSARNNICARHLSFRHRFRNFVRGSKNGGDEFIRFGNLKLVIWSNAFKNTVLIDGGVTNFLRYTRLVDGCRKPNRTREEGAWLFAVVLGNMSNTKKSSRFNGDVCIWKITILSTTFVQRTL